MWFTLFSAAFRGAIFRNAPLGRIWGKLQTTYTAVWVGGLVVNFIYNLISWNSTLNYYNLYLIFDSVTSTDFSKRQDQLLRHLQLSQHHLLINL